jgi:uncharacterized protein YraI
VSASVSPGAPKRTYRVLPNVSEGKLNVREGPGTNYRLVGELPAGAAGITVSGCRMPDDGGRAPWCNVTRESLTGWVSSRGIVDEKTGAHPQ